MDNLYYEYLNIINEDIPDFLKKYLNLKSLNRLKNIGYFCGMDYASKNIYFFKEKITRYDHSFSVAMLTFKFTKDKSATIAGLIHDIATPCFAHVIDYMNGDFLNQESTEEYTEKIILGDNELLQFLKEDGIDVNDIVNFKKYSIVDNNRPMMCADRFDGLILTGIGWTKSVTLDDIKLLVNDLAIYKNEYGFDELGFKNIKSAKRAVDISKEIDIFCHSNEDNYMMNLLASITSEVINNNIVSYDELYYLNEDELIFKIKNCSIDKIKKMFNEFQSIKLKDIPIICLENVKVRDLNPLVNGKRLKNY